MKEHIDRIINSACNCKKKCERHGNCEECRKHHLKIKTKTSCEREVKKL